MPQPFDRVFNFSAGPGVLPVQVLEEIRDEVLNYRGAGMGVMEMSHRSAAFEQILFEAKADLRSLMGISDEYEILFLQGGASSQFTMVPMSFLGSGTAQYIVTGAWGQKAIEAGRFEGEVEVLWDGKADEYRSIPNEIGENELASYVHITTNETIQGVRFGHDISVTAPLICDMSSDILSRPVDVSKYDLIYAGAQKNMGPAGATVVIIKKELLDGVSRELPPMMDYRVHVKNDSMYNTPPCWAIYVCGKVYRRLLSLGGLMAVHENNIAKSGVVYSAIDESNGFYRGHAVTEARSLMNVTFTLAEDGLTKSFVSEADALGMKDLKGHRSVGGCRASIYNAFPNDGCIALADFMREFAHKNG